MWLNDILQNSINEIISCQETIPILIQFPEQIGDSGFLVIVVFKEAFSPIIPIKVLDLFEFLEIIEFFLEATIALPSHHPDMTPFLPKSLSTWVLVIVALAYAGAAEMQI